jgi:hypothetical protein
MIGSFCYRCLVNLLYSLSDQAFIDWVVFIPAKCFTVQFERVVRRGFQALNVVVRGFTTERAAWTANVARVAYIPTYTVMADLLLSRVFRMGSGVKG